jgi:hypothetical protein
MSKGLGLLQREVLATLPESAPPDVWHRGMALDKGSGEPWHCVRGLDVILADGIRDLIVALNHRLAARWWGLGGFLHILQPCGPHPRHARIDHTRVARADHRIPRCSPGTSRPRQRLPLRGWNVFRLWRTVSTLYWSGRRLYTGRGEDRDSGRLSPARRTGDSGLRIGARHKSLEGF